MSLRLWLCPRTIRDDHTREVLAEAERTRIDLVTMTGRLDDFVGQLQERVSYELQRRIKEGMSGG